MTKKQKEKRKKEEEGGEMNLISCIQLFGHCVPQNIWPSFEAPSNHRGPCATDKAQFSWKGGEGGEGEEGSQVKPEKDALYAA